MKKINLFWQIFYYFRNQDSNFSRKGRILTNNFRLKNQTNSYFHQIYRQIRRNYMFSADSVKKFNILEPSFIFSKYFVSLNDTKS